MKTPLSHIKAAAVAAFLLTTAATQAAVLWSATSLSNFKSLEEQDCEGNYHSDNGSSAAIVTDPVHGNVIRFRKVSTDRRCEAKGASGITITRGQTYYLGWRFKQSSTANDNSIFQWKAYGSPMNQNYPFVIKLIGGRVTFQYYPPNSDGVTNLYSAPISTNTWYTVALRIHVSDSASGGSISLWFNGDPNPKTLSTGGTSLTCKSFDGSTIDPKWGKYGGCGTQIDSFVDDLKIGTTLADVYAGGTGPGTPISFEAESLSRATSGPTATNDTDTAASGGSRVTLNSSTNGAWVEFTTPSIPAGTYSLAMAYKTNGNRAIASLSVDGGAQLGSTVDQYASSATYPTRTFGTVTFASAGTHRIRLTAAGKNTASSSYTLSADKFTLTPQ